MNRDVSSVRRTLLLVMALALVVVGLGACGDDAEEGGTDAAATTTTAATEETPAGGEDGAEGGTEFVVEAKEYEFSFPETMPAGETTFVLKNVGEQPHHLILAKLTEDAPPVEKLIKLPNAEKFLEEDISGENPPQAEPGGTSDETVTATLTPGTYGYVCFIGDKEKKKPHAFLGMYGSFTVE